MGAGVTGSRLHWSQPSLRRCSSPSQNNFASLFYAKRRGGVDAFDRSLSCPVFSQIRSPFLVGSISFEDFNPSGRRRRISGRSQSLPSVFNGGVTDDDETDDEFIRRLQELGIELQEDDITSVSLSTSVGSENSPSAKPPWPAIRPEPPKWLNGDEIVPASVEMRANRVDMPLSLRMIKRKKRWEEEGMKGSGESAYCSIKKAFSSMVFIVRELQSYTLQMREVLLYENLQGILARVQGEMNASFVWLFQQIFSCTPTFMVYVMLLLANFTVYSIGHNSAIASVSSNPPVTVQQQYHRSPQQQLQSSRLDASFIKSFSVGGHGSGGGKAKPVAGATDGGKSDDQAIIVPADGISRIPIERSETAAMEEEKGLWDKIVEEASRMQASLRDDTLMDSSTLNGLVSPVTVELEPEDYSVYSKTELMYLEALSQDPDNVLLLCNFAQFLFVVLHDHDRAEYYFKRAAGVKPRDAEAVYRYAMFLWIARKDLEGAEELYVEAMDAADPGNSHYAANYAHFLWNSGGEDTCYPLDGSDAC